MSEDCISPKSILSDEKLVLLPTYTSNLHTVTANEKSVCRMTYEDGKTCFGRYLNGMCDNYSVEKLAEYEGEVKIEVLVVSDNEKCVLENLNDWSECSGEDGRPANCGPGRLYIKNYDLLSRRKSLLPFSKFRKLSRRVFGA